jgi:hypothetical protein
LYKSIDKNINQMHKYVNPQDTTNTLNNAAARNPSHNQAPACAKPPPFWLARDGGGDWELGTFLSVTDTGSRELELGGDVTVASPQVPQSETSVPIAALLHESKTSAEQVGKSEVDGHTSLLKKM